MSDDIVEKIVMKGKAAEEIRRLRAENEKLIKDVKTAVFADSAELKDIKKDNERLRRYEKLVEYIASDYWELSHDKIRWLYTEYKEKSRKLIQEDGLI